MARRRPGGTRPLGPGPGRERTGPQELHDQVGRRLLTDVEATCRGPSALADDVRRVEVVLTASCNLSCGYCYQNDKKARRMDWDVLRAAADLVLSSNRSQVGMLFIGGEPLLE